MRTGNIDFDRELSRGLAAYNGQVGCWWSRQAANSFHSYAYRNIAGFIRSSFSRPPSVIVDYACGAGNLLFRLHHRFPDANLVGYDGSMLLLDMARRRLRRLGSQDRQRISLHEVSLPDFELPKGGADLALFVFPNMVSCVPKEGKCRWTGGLSPQDLRVARTLATPRDSEDAAMDDPETVYATLLRDRLVSLNLRHLLKRDGICIRVEYASVPREQLTELETLRTGFEEGSLDQRVGGELAAPWFRVAASRFHRSGVIEDVHHQSSDKNHKTGGYFITVLRALSGA